MSKFYTGLGIIYLLIATYLTVSGNPDNSALDALIIAMISFLFSDIEEIKEMIK